MPLAFFSSRFRCLENLEVYVLSLYSLLKPPPSPKKISSMEGKMKGMGRGREGKEVLQEPGSYLKAQLQKELKTMAEGSLCRSYRNLV
jgi:hypothetical protein